MRWGNRVAGSVWNLQLKPGACPSWTLPPTCTLQRRKSHELWRMNWWWREYLLSGTTRRSSRDEEKWRAQIMDEIFIMSKKNSQVFPSWMGRVMQCGTHPKIALNTLSVEKIKHRKPRKESTFDFIDYLYGIVWHFHLKLLSPKLTINLSRLISGKRKRPTCTVPAEHSNAKQQADEIWPDGEWNLNWPKNGQN